MLNIYFENQILRLKILQRKQLPPSLAPITRFCIYLIENVYRSVLKKYIYMKKS